MRTFQVPGMAVAIVKDGEVIHSKGYGVRSLNTRKPVDEHTLFGIASNSKAFTAAALGILVDEGKMKWDDKVRDYIPEFKLSNPYVTEEFTIRDLLTHRSGLGLGAGDLMFFPDSSDFTTKDIIYNLRFLKSTSSFRSKFDYDNNLYIIAGEVVKRVSGQSWGSFVEERIFQPLGMTESATSFTKVRNRPNIIDGHTLIDGQLQVIPHNVLKAGGPAGGINSNINDLSKWVIVQLAQGKYGIDNKETLLTKRTHGETWSPQTILPVRSPGRYNTHFMAYGLGFFLSDAKGYKQVSHTGGLEGMVTQITMIPELNLGIIVLTNQEDANAFASVTDQIKDAYFGITGTDRIAEYGKESEDYVDKERRRVDSLWTVAKRSPDISMYAASYKDNWLGEVTISSVNGKPWFASKRSPKLSGELYYYKGNTFILKWGDRSMHADAYVSFNLDEIGKPKGFTMKPISSLADFSYDFQDLDFVRFK
jgi:CubicO group peptidase (beta-lactamase class C family)